LHYYQPLPQSEIYFVLTIQPYGLFTESLKDGIRVKSSAEAPTKSETRNSSAKPAAGNEIPAEHELPSYTPSVSAWYDRIKSSVEAAIKPETRNSSAKPAASREIPAEHELPKSATKADKPATSDVARRTIKAAKKARQRAAKYGPEKLLLAQTLPEMQVTFKKDPTDSM
jgi:hypothetical protein